MPTRYAGRPLLLLPDEGALEGCGLAEVAVVLGGVGVGEGLGVEEGVS